MLPDVDLRDVMAVLEPVQRNAVELVYFQGRTTAEVAQILAIERAAVGPALAAAFRCVASWVADDGVHVESEPTNFPATAVRVAGRHAARHATGQSLGHPSDDHYDIASTA